MREENKNNENKVPGPTIRGTYSTYEDSRQRDLNEILGHVVDFTLEKVVQIELGAWGTKLKLIIPENVKIEMVKEDGKPTRIYLGYY